jgi:putative transposase
MSGKRRWGRKCANEQRRTLQFVATVWVVLPEHMHCVIELPIGDADFAVRWRLIKMRFSKSLPDKEWRSATRLRHGKRGIWQRRYWEHLIRDDQDFAAHMDYVHVNPLKHGLLRRVADWRYSTFHHLVAQGVYPLDWAGGFESGIDYAE